MSERRIPDDLKEHALIFWPAQMAEKERTTSIIPLLLKTQSKFISLLHVADKDPFCWKTILSVTKKLPPNLFLKHLMILSDLGGEKLKRFRTELQSVFQDEPMEFIWNGQSYQYKFQSLADGGNWSNSNLSVDGERLASRVELTKEMEDVTMLLMFGANCLNDALPEVILERCVIGNLLGNKKELDTFVRQRYLWVSRITGGATANRMGYIAEDYVREVLMNLLTDWDFSGKTIPGISQNDGRTSMRFDMVARSPEGKYCPIEISFQVTTNSTIERKAGQAQGRQSVLHARGHSIAYVIDGAGNFERHSALSTICQYSDCTVSFKDSEIQTLAEFLRGL